MAPPPTLADGLFNYVPSLTVMYHIIPIHNIILHLMLLKQLSERHAPTKLRMARTRYHSIGKS